MTPALLAALWTLPGVWLVAESVIKLRPSDLAGLNRARAIAAVVCGVWLWPAMLVILALQRRA